ncbi:hypothetical protein [Caulobacter phage BL94]|nr:hypothetical protein [Caulobacter phage BL94]
MTTIRVKARLAFQPPWKATSINGGPEKFRARLMFDPDTDWGKESIKLIRDTRKAVAKDKWKAKADGILEMNKNDRNKESWFESDYRSQDGEVVAGFEGMYHLSTLADVMPLIIDKDRTELSRKDGRPYSGCYVIAQVEIWAQDNDSGKAMRAGIQGLQFWKDGDAFGGGGKIAKVDDFEDLSDQGDDDEAPRSSRRPPVVADDDDDQV